MYRVSRVNPRPLNAKQFTFVAISRCRSYLEGGSGNLIITCLPMDEVEVKYTQSLSSSLFCELRKIILTLSERQSHEILMSQLL